MEKWTRWQGWVALAAGAGAALSPLLIDMDNRTTWTMVVLGVATAAVALWSLTAPDHRMTAYALMLMGVLLIASPWVLEVADLDNNIALTAWIAGAVTAVAGLLGMPEVERRTHRGPIAH